MELFECLMERRSCRRFKQDAISREDIDKMIDAGRYAPTGANRQPVRFAVITSPEKAAEMFEHTGWLTGTPVEGERPTAYIIIMCDTTAGGGAEASAACAATTVMLAAHALGYGSCWCGCHGKEEVVSLLGLPENIEPRITISLGRYAEEFVVHDPSPELKVAMQDDGKIHLGKLGREDVTLTVL